MEFASVFSALGCRVTVVEALERILANMDKEISQNLKMIMKKRGVDIHAAAMVQEIAADPEGGLICSYTEKDKPAQAQGDLVLIATGAAGLHGRAVCSGRLRGREVHGNGPRTDSGKRML